MSGGETLRFGPYSVDVAHLDKVLFPEAGVTKGDLVEHYRRVSDRIVPFLADRPVVMQRFPDGIDGEGFYQKDVPDYFPDWIETVEVEKEGGTVTHAVCGNEATLVYLANQACVTPHVWLARRDRLHHPDRLIFDLDPPGDDFEPVRHAAKSLHGLLDELGLRSFAMTTGGRGLHLWVPLDRGDDFDAVRDFAHRTADLLAAREPDRLTTATRKDQREGRLFLDYLRNSYAQTAVPPWAVRPRAGAPVAVPIGWEEIDDPDLAGNRWTIGSVPDRLESGAEPWKGIGRHARSLADPRERLEALEEEAGSPE